MTEDDLDTTYAGDVEDDNAVPADLPPVHDGPVPADGDDQAVAK